MTDVDRTRTRRRVGAAAALLAAGALAGGVLAGTMSASAAGSTPSSTGSSTSANGAAPASGYAQGQGRPGGADPVRSDETKLTGTDAEKVRAAALTAVPGGTVYRVETDAGDAAYEAHMTKADGTPVTVKLDKDFAVTGVEDGMGKGDPAPAGAPSGSAPNAPNGAPNGTPTGA